MADSATTIRSDASTTPSTAPAAADTVQVRVPAKGSYISVLRTVTATLAARARFTIDEIEDLRIAVDEACAMLVAQAAGETELTCRFDIEPDGLEITVTVPSTSGAVPARDTFGWTVLSALAGGADAGFDDGLLWIRLHKSTELAATTAAG